MLFRSAAELTHLKRSRVEFIKKNVRIASSCRIHGLDEISTEIAVMYDLIILPCEVKNHNVS